MNNIVSVIMGVLGNKQDIYVQALVQTMLMISKMFKIALLGKYLMKSPQMPKSNSFLLNRIIYLNYILIYFEFHFFHKQLIQIIMINLNLIFVVEYFILITRRFKGSKILNLILLITKMYLLYFLNNILIIQIYLYHHS